MRTKIKKNYPVSENPKHRGNIWNGRNYAESGDSDAGGTATIKTADEETVQIKGLERDGMRRCRGYTNQEPAEG